MPAHVADLSPDFDFLFHLGDLQYALEDQCREGAYKEASAILKQSPVPVFVLPGDNDLNDCPNHDRGEAMWNKYFDRPDATWGRKRHGLSVTRWGALDESFSFAHRGVLYLGLNMVGGRPYSDREKRERHAEHLRQARRLLGRARVDDDVAVVVLLAHARPRSYHDDFFEGEEGFVSLVRQLGKPVVHLHGDDHYWDEDDGAFGLKNYVRISLDGESKAPPIEVEIDVGRPNPVRVSRRRRNLRVQCCGNGWPNGEEV